MPWPRARLARPPAPKHFPRGGLPFNLPRPTRSRVPTVRHPPPAPGSPTRPGETEAPPTPPAPWNLAPDRQQPPARHFSRPSAAVLPGVSRDLPVGRTVLPLFSRTRWREARWPGAPKPVGELLRSVRGMCRGPVAGRAPEFPRRGPWMQRTAKRVKLSLTTDGLVADPQPPAGAARSRASSHQATRNAPLSGD